MRYLDATKKIEYTTYHPAAYVASGWFNPCQEEARQDILEALETVGISYFSPKEEVEVKPDATPEERKQAFEADVFAISYCDFMIASTVGKDMGTLMEMGMAYILKTPIIVYFPAPAGTPCNLMISETAVAVAQSKEELINILRTLRESDFEFESIRKSWTAEIE